MDQELLGKPIHDRVGHLPGAGMHVSASTASSAAHRTLSKGLTCYNRSPGALASTETHSIPRRGQIGPLDLRDSALAATDVHVRSEPAP